MRQYILVILMINNWGYRLSPILLPRVQPIVIPSSSTTATAFIIITGAPWNPLDIANLHKIVVPRCAVDPIVSYSLGMEIGTSSIFAGAMSLEAIADAQLLIF